MFELSNKKKANFITARDLHIKKIAKYPGILYFVILFDSY